jgi:hypothetical protein
MHMPFERPPTLPGGVHKAGRPFGSQAGRNAAKRIRRTEDARARARAMMRRRRPSLVKTTNHRSMLDLGVERRRKVNKDRYKKRIEKVNNFCDVRAFPGLVDLVQPLDASVVGVRTKPPTLLSALNTVTRASSQNHLSLPSETVNAQMGWASASCSNLAVRSRMKKPAVRLSRNDLISSSLGDINFLLQFKRLAFEKAHCPPAPRNFNPRKDKQTRADFSLGASVDAERFRTIDQKHGRGWVADPFQDKVPNFRGYQAGKVKGASGELQNFTVRNPSGAKEKLKRKQFMTLSSPLFPPGTWATANQNGVHNLHRNEELPSAARFLQQADHADHLLLGGGVSEEDVFVHEKDEKEEEEEKDEYPGAIL